MASTYPETRQLGGDEDHCDINAFLRGRQVASTRLSPDKEFGNEDGALVLQLGPESGVLAIADGAGGHAAGREASSLALAHLERELLAADNIRELRAPILNAFESANTALLADGRGAATTLVVVELQGDTIRHFHAGDSSALVVGQRGAVRLQTIAQSLVGYGIEAGLLDTDAALDHDERHVVLSLVGTPDMRVEIGAPFQLRRFDTLLVCSDGLTDNVGVPDIVEQVRKGDLRTSLDSLYRLATGNMAMPNGHPDDLTVSLYRRRM